MKLSVLEDAEVGCDTGTLKTGLQSCGSRYWGLQALWLRLNNLGVFSGFVVLFRPYRIRSR